MGNLQINMIWSRGKNHAFGIEYCVAPNKEFYHWLLNVGIVLLLGWLKQKKKRLKKRGKTRNCVAIRMMICFQIWIFNYSEIHKIICSSGVVILVLLLYFVHYCVFACVVWLIITGNSKLLVILNILFNCLYSSISQLQRY